MLKPYSKDILQIYVTIIRKKDEITNKIQIKYIFREGKLRKKQDFSIEKMQNIKSGTSKSRKIPL